ncbi:MAG TPA: Ig-like domain-containing protein [Candidatus Limnocylindria bacterium]|nr:Ig-like domain-containing protein [Candidatus Limnocylindria bacterium]
MRDRLRAVITTAVSLAMAWAALGVTPAAAADPLKVVIIVGPTGAQTDGYRSTGNSIANAAEAAGAEVVKVYSPRATWARVRNAVAGANVVVYLGHGNGYPSPYSTSEWTDRVNGWGLNRTTENGDSDNWSTTMVYCGEKALLGTLTASDGSAQWNYCGGKTNTDGIAPAANWVMIYNKACYTPGAGEGWDVKATESVAFQRVRNYSYPALKQGGGAYFATDMYQGGQQLVDLVLRNRDMTFGEIAEAANGFSLAAQRRFAHNELTGRQVWIQRTSTGMGTDYWFAYAGNPSMTPSGVMGTYVPPAPPVVTGRSPDANQTDVAPETYLEVTFDQPVTGVSGKSFKVADAYGLRVTGTVTYQSATRTARFMPAAPLETGMKYKVSLTSGIRSALGATLAGTSYWFTAAGSLPATVTAYAPAAELVLGVGTNTGYKFAVNGVMVAAKHATLAEPVVATTTMRRTIANQGGTWFFVASGTWKGYWLQQSSAVTLAGTSAASATESQLFSPARTIALRKGTHTGYRFSADGAMTVAKTATVSYRQATTTQLRSLPGQTGLWFRVTSGTWSGYWLRSSSVVRLMPD